MPATKFFASQPSDQEFSISHMTFGVSERNRFGQQAIAAAYVTVGLFRFRAHVMPDGACSFTEDLGSPHLRHEISCALRVEALQAAAAKWAKEDAREKQRLMAVAGAHCTRSTAGGGR